MILPEVESQLSEVFVPLNSFGDHFGLAVVYSAELDRDAEVLKLEVSDLFEFFEGFLF